MYEVKSFNNRTIGATERLQISTVRSYEGGLNVADTDLNMSPKYAKVLDNIERGVDGTLSVRPGTTLLARVGASTSQIVNCYYFSGYVITVQEDGSFHRVDGTGTVTNMGMVVGGGNPFTGSTEFVSFTIFSSDLIVCNGKDKPILVEGNTTSANYLKPDFLQDLASGSNVNTPIGKYVVTHGQYCIIAGISAAPSTIYISAKDTSGTWPNDGPPNDAVAIDLGPRVSVGSSTITGLVAYRDKLVVTFERGVLPMNLGVYTTGTTPVHAPTDDGFIEEFGCLAHRSLISVGDDTWYNDNIGVNSINRIALFYTLRPVRISQLIDPLTTAAIQPLSSAQIQQYVFAVYDMQHFRYMLFVPTFDGSGNVIETVGFSYTNIPKLGVSAWARLRGWKWRCGCRTALQNIIFCESNKVYYYDFAASDNVDYKGDSDYGTTAGVPITFEWELPWADFKNRMEVKKTRYLGLDTKGTAQFTVEAFVDNIMTYQGNDAPLLTMQFVGGDGQGYGGQLYGNSPYGGGRRTSEERLYAFPMLFKLMKLRFSGTDTGKLKFVSISIAYQRGSIRR